MQSLSESRETKGETRHVDLDQKHSDTVFYDAGYMPDLQDMKTGRRRQKGIVSRPHLSKSKRKKVFQQKKLFMELSKDCKLSDKKSTLSREERRVKRQLFIMDSKRLKTSTQVQNTKPKKIRRSFKINEKFNLGNRKTPKTFLQWYWEKKEIPLEEEEVKLDMESQSENESEELNLSDREDIRQSCGHYFNLKRTAKNKRKTSKKKESSMNNLDKSKKETDLNIQGMSNSNGSIENLLSVKPDVNLVLEKRNFKNAFIETLGEDSHKIQVESDNDKIDSLGKLGLNKEVNLSESTESSNEVIKKTLGEGVVCLDLTQHFKKYPLITPIN